MTKQTSKDWLCLFFNLTYLCTSAKIAVPRFQNTTLLVLFSFELVLVAGLLSCPRSTVKLSQQTVELLD